MSFAGPPPHANTTPPTPQTKSAESRQLDTRQRILLEAARLFVQRGYHGVSMREVAAAVGVTKPALYHHYADKETLFVAILNDSLGDLEAITRTMQREMGLHARLHALVDGLTERQPNDWIGLQLAGELKHISPESRASFEQLYRRVWLGGLGRVIGEAVEAGELRSDLTPQELTRALLGILYPLVSGPASAHRKEAAGALLKVFLEGATPRG